MKKNTGFAFLFLLIILSACHKEYNGNEEILSRPASVYSAKELRGYFTLLCKISKSTPGFFPPQVARAYGYVGITNYETVVNGIPGAQHLAGQVSGLSAADYPQPLSTLEYNWSIASNAAVSDMIRKMFEKKITAVNAALIDSTEQANLLSLSASVNADVASRSVDFGKRMAAVLYNYSTTDGGHESYLDPFQLPYTIPPDPGCWVPTGALTTPVSPKWGENRLFVQASLPYATEYTATPFATAATSGFYIEAMQVYNQVARNTPEQRTIAKYWSDDPFNTCTPTGHTFNIMTQLLEESNATLEKSTVAFARLAIAENDAFIVCWKQKYKSALIRPVSYIKKYIDPAFVTVIGSPAFPSFVSGHSAEIGAGSRVFTDMFTDGSGNYNFTDYSQLQYGFAARSYTSFNQMADECAASRFYAGIHYPMDNNDGLAMGKKVGDNVNTMINWPKNIR